MSVNELITVIAASLTGAVPTIAAIVIAVFKIVGAIRKNRRLEDKIDGLIDLICLDYQSRRSVTPIEKAAMSELATKVRGGQKINGAKETVETRKELERLADTIERLAANETAIEAETEWKPLPEGFIDGDTIA